MSRKANTPYTLGTSSRMRNIIIAIVAVCLVAAGVFYALYREAPVNKVDPADVPAVIARSENESLNTPQRAADAINAYYSALAANDSAKLMEVGAVNAANAINNGWLKSMDYSADAGKLATAYRDEFPPSAGIWAGNTLYNIADFYAGAPENAIRNNVTGLTGPVGWVYFDIVQGHWMIADPTIPTAVNAAESPKVEKSSSDKLVTVKVQSVGALANPWWCYAQVEVNVSSTSQDSEVTLAPRGFDEGVTLNIPPNLTQPVAMATAESSEQQSGGVTATKITPQKLNGVCTIYRGTLSGFAINKIGSPPLTLNGDIMPLSVNTTTENITPIFAIGDASLDEIQKMMTQEEIDRYNATNAELPAVPTINAGNTNSTNSGTNSRGTN